MTITRDLHGSYEGEILQVQDKIGGDKQNLIRYTCLVYFSDGVKVIPNVRQSSMLGGIADYWRRRATATSDDSASTQALGSTSQPGLDATVGERVIITFLNGNISNPVITGYLQHPDQAIEEDLDDSNPDVNAIFQYLGIRATINSDGELTLTHKGLPTVSWVPQGSVAGSGLANALSAIDNVGGNNSPAIVPAPETEVTLFEFLKGGVFRVRDEEGQSITIDRTNKEILISNNNLGSTETILTDLPTDAEYIKFDKGSEELTVSARQNLVLNSDDERNDTTIGDYEHDIGGDSDVTVAGDQSTTVVGSKKTNVAGSWKINTTGSFQVSAKAGLSFSGIDGEVLDLFNKTLEQVMNAFNQIILESNQASGNLGYAVVVNPALVSQITEIVGNLTEIQATLDSITA